MLGEDWPDVVLEELDARLIDRSIACSRIKDWIRSDVANRRNRQ
jgi:hypothetical protein